MYPDHLSTDYSTNDGLGVAELDDIIGELEMEIPNATAALGTCSRWIYCVP